MSLSDSHEPSVGRTDFKIENQERLGIEAFANGDYSVAHKCFEEMLFARAASLGDSHPEVMGVVDSVLIASTHHDCCKRILEAQGDD
jgi:hypothetical protein